MKLKPGVKGAGLYTIIRFSGAVLRRRYPIMAKIFIKIKTLAALFILLSVLIGCGFSMIPETIDALTRISVTGVTVDKTSISLVVGGTETITPTITPSNATNKNVTWSSSNTSVATVSGGVVTAVAAGTATITVTTVDGGKTAACIVTVSDVPIPVTGIMLNKKSTGLVVNGTEILFAIIEPSNATNKAVTWLSGSPAVATVSESGEVTGISAGTATVIVTTKDGGYQATCTVNVGDKAVPVTGISLNKKSISLFVGDRETLFAYIEPSNATNQNVTWKSGNTAVATVSTGGVVTGVGVGTTTITVTAKDTTNGTKYDTCTVKVDPVPVTGVSLDKTSISLFAGDTTTLSATITPSNATNKNVTWSSTNPDVAEVSTNGIVSAKKQGTTTITATTVDGNLKATCPVEVKSVPVTGISLDKTSVSLFVGDTVTLSMTIMPSNATNKNFSFTLSNPNNLVATVTKVSNNDLLVRGDKVGEVTITVTAEDTTNGVKTAICTVNINPVPVTGVTLNKSSISLLINGTETLTAVITPSNAANKNVNWTSSNTSVATVTEAGKVTTVAPGTATITVTAEDTTNGIKSASCTVMVNSWIVYDEPTWNDAVNRIKNGGNNKTYTITVTGSFSIPGTTDYTFSNVTGITVTIVGDKEISLATGSTGSLLYTGANQTVIIKDLNLKGHYGNGTSLVTIWHYRTDANSYFTMQGSATVFGNNGYGVLVNNGTFTMQDNATVSGNADIGVRIWRGTFTMQDNATVSGNTASYYGGGVSVSDGTFTMQGSAAVSGNTSSHGGGVSVDGGGTFTMQDNATVSGNTKNGVYVNGGGTFTMQDNATVSSNTGSVGGGVYVSGGIFTMKDNTTVSSNSSYSGGGVFIWGGIFTMLGSATVSGNTSSDSGGGVYVREGTFTMQGNTTVSGNTSSSWGGGVCVGIGIFTMKDNTTVSGNTSSYGGGVSVGEFYVNGGTFTMQGSATVSGNTSSYGGGGGVYVYGSTFTMKDNATVSGNTSSSHGGGVSLGDGGGTFTMQDNATVSGNTSSKYGGGVFVWSGTFTLVGGTVYGDVGTPMENTSGRGTGAALYVQNTDSAKYGNGTNILLLFDTNNFAYYTNNTIKR